MDQLATALPSSWYMIIEGAIGVGKTTLASMLRERLNCSLLLEVFEENPFLADFYRSREQYAFQTQMFFLLSRYRQLQRVPQLLQEGALVSDYMFAKDRLFAHLNLKEDEYGIYDQLHTLLTKQIPEADLVVYLQADTDVLMGRIARRGRPYEKDMDWEYIQAVRHAYEEFFQKPQSFPVLPIDTNKLNIVANPDDFQLVLDCITSRLREVTLCKPDANLGTSRSTCTLQTLGNEISIPQAEMFLSQTETGTRLLREQFLDEADRQMSRLKMIKRQRMGGQGSIYCASES